MSRRFTKRAELGVDERPAGVVVRVAVDAPQHSGLNGPLDYASEQALASGSLVRVPLGKRELLGVVWPGEAAAEPQVALRPVAAVFSTLPPLGADWCRLLDFAAGYYQRSVGELASAVLPPQLRELSPEQLAARLRKLDKKPARAAAAAPVRPQLAPEQAEAVSRIEAQIASAAPRPLLLFGVTGSGKTEVYLRAASAARR